MRAGVRVLEGQELADEGVGFHEAESVVALDGGLTGHRGDFVVDGVRGRHAGFVGELVEDLEEEFLLAELREVGRDGGDAVVAIAEAGNHIAELLEVAHVLLEDAGFVGGQGQENRWIQVLAGRLLLAEAPHHALEVYLLVRGVLVDDVKLVAVLNEPVGLEDLPDDAVRGARLFTQKALGEQGFLLRLLRCRRCCGIGRHGRSCVCLGRCRWSYVGSGALFF